MCDWIRIDKELPPQNAPVLLYDADIDSICIAYLRDHHWYGNEFRIVDPVYWMQLPKKPKGMDVISVHESYQQRPFTY